MTIRSFYPTIMNISTMWDKSRGGALIDSVNHSLSTDSLSALDRFASSYDIHRMEQIWHWEARNDNRNIARSYHLEVSRDLFGWTIVDQRWGRIGAGAGQGRRVAFASDAEASRHIEGVRRRRASALQRIGAAYIEQ